MMDHKEFLDEVINDMESDVTESDSMDNSIQLKMSTGEVYLVDPDTFDWDNAIKNLPQMAENENTLCEIMFSLLNVTDPTNEDSVEFVKHTINQLEDFMNNLQIHPNYEAFDANISDYKKALFMVFDAMNVVKIMNHHTSAYQILNMFYPVGQNECSCGCGNDCECNHEEPKIFKVTGTCENDIVRIINFEESDCSPDKIGIPEYDDDGNMVVFVCCRDINECLETAHSIFLTWIK